MVAPDWHDQVRQLARRLSCSQRQSPSASRKVSGVAVLSLREGSERGQSSASSPTALREVQDEFVPQAAHAGNKFRTIFSRQFRQSRHARLCARAPCGAMLTRSSSSALVMKQSPHSNHNHYQPAPRTICRGTDGSAPTAFHRCRNPKCLDGARLGYAASAEKGSWSRQQDLTIT